MRAWQFVSSDMRPASHETAMQIWLWRHNQFAVFVLVAVEVIALFLLDHSALAERYRPYLGRVYGGAVALACVELLLWHFLYRHGGTEARWAAGLMGLWYAILILVRLARASIGVGTTKWIFVILTYMVVARWSYAFFGSRARR